jgi:hypothetical protein
MMAVNPHPADPASTSGSKPTRKWWIATAIGLVTIVGMFAVGGEVDLSDGLDVTEIGTLGILLQRLGAYLVENANTPGGVPR